MPSLQKIPLLRAIISCAGPGAIRRTPDFAGQLAHQGPPRHTPAASPRTAPHPTRERSCQTEGSWLLSRPKTRARHGAEPCPMHALSYTTQSGRALTAAVARWQVPPGYGAGGAGMHQVPDRARRGP